MTVSSVLSRFLLISASRRQGLTRFCEHALAQFVAWLPFILSCLAFLISVLNFLRSSSLQQHSFLEQVEIGLAVVADETIHYLHVVRDSVWYGIGWALFGLMGVLPGYLLPGMPMKPFICDQIQKSIQSIHCCEYWIGSQMNKAGVG